MTIQTNGMAPLIQVYDMPRSVAFYRDVLGFELVSTSDEVDAPEGRYFHWCWLRLGSVDLMLNTAYDEGERPPEPDPDRIETHRDIGLFFDCADVDAAAEHLKAHGLDIDGPATAPYGMRQLWLRDPDGYELCFQAPA